MLSLPVLTSAAALLGSTPAVDPVVTPLVAPVVSAAAQRCPGAGRAPGQASNAAVRSTVLCLLNRRRAAHGLGPLRTNARLARAALGHTRDMVSHRYFAHDSRNGERFDARIRAVGYMSDASYWWVGENLAWGAGPRATPRLIVRSWMHSPGHRRNILDGRFAEIGIAVVRGAPVARRFALSATYATEFGARG